MTTKPESAKEYPLNYHSPCGCFLSLHGYDEAGDPIVETIKECPKCTSQSLKAGDANCRQCSDLRTQLHDLQLRHDWNVKLYKEVVGDYERSIKRETDLRAQLEAAKGQLKVYAIVLHNIEDVCIRAGADSPQNPETIGYVMELNRQLAAEKQRADNAERIANQIAHKLDDAKVENYRLRKALEEIRDFDGYWQSNGE